MQMTNLLLLGNCSFHNTNKLSQDWNPSGSWLLATATIFAVNLLPGLGPIIRKLSIITWWASGCILAEFNERGVGDAMQGALTRRGKPWKMAGHLEKLWFLIQILDFFMRMGRPQTLCLLPRGWNNKYPLSCWVTGNGGFTVRNFRKGHF